MEIKINNSQKKIISGLSSEVRINLLQKDAYFIPSSLISLDDNGKIGIKVIQEKNVLFLTIDIISDTGNGYWVNSNSKNNLEDYMLITQGHEYVIEGESVTIKNLMIDKILNSSKLLLTILFFLITFGFYQYNSLPRESDRYKFTSNMCHRYIIKEFPQRIQKDF